MSVPGPDSSGAAVRARLRGVDVVRGAVMLLMAIDHVRVYSGLPAGGPAPAIFFTRWITHFCAPAFIFLAGTSAFLYAQRHADVSGFLFKRGLWLVLLELTYFRVMWTFNFEFRQYELAGVIWVIGWCMVLMAGLVRLPVKAIAIVGLAIVAGHNLLDGYVDQLTPTLSDSVGSDLWRILYVGFFGDPNPWSPPATGPRGPHLPSLLSFLAATKYPASLDFLLMTLGPTIALLPMAQRASGRLARFLSTFGRVPFFYYALHIPLIHVLALAVSKARLGEVSWWLFTNHPMGNPPPPDGYTWSLPLLYAVWAIAIALLYPACRWMADVKARHGDEWLRYV